MKNADQSLIRKKGRKKENIKKNKTKKTLGRSMPRQSKIDAVILARSLKPKWHTIFLENKKMYSRNGAT